MEVLHGLNGSPNHLKHVNVRIMKHIRICALVVALDYSIAEVQQKMVHVIQISVQFIYFCEKHSKFFFRNVR